jgi:hypothetical protein
MEKFPSWKEIEEIVSAQKKYVREDEQNAIASPATISMEAQLLSLKSLSVKIEIQKNIEQYREENYNGKASDNINTPI